MSVIKGMTLAVVDMDAMLQFYTNVFDLHFTPTTMMEHTLYQGNWGGLSIQFCPAELARNSATQNRHQLDIMVDDIHKCVEKVKENRGSLMAEISETDSMYSVGVYDPDHNSLVIQQMR